MPLLNMVSNVGGRGLEESDEELQPSIILHKDLEKSKQCLSISFKGTI